MSIEETAADQNKTGGIQSSSVSVRNRYQKHTRRVKNACLPEIEALFKLSFSYVWEMHCWQTVIFDVNQCVSMPYMVHTW